LSDFDRDMGIVGTTLDQEKFDQLKKQWIRVGYRTWHCPIHHTFFDLIGDESADGQDAEPCWACYDSCQERI